MYIYMSQATTINKDPVKETKKKNNDECIELKNIKYQTMLINNKMEINQKKETTNISNIEDFLNKEREYNQKQPWSKLGEGSKLKKIAAYVDDYAVKNKITDPEKRQLNKYLKKCMERKKLQRVKDVQYNIELGKIISIPGLLFNDKRKKFTLKNMDKKGSTLKSLAPKKRIKRKKIKSKEKSKEKTPKKNN